MVSLNTIGKRRGILKFLCCSISSTRDALGHCLSRMPRLTAVDRAQICCPFRYADEVIHRLLSVVGQLNKPPTSFAMSSASFPNMFLSSSSDTIDGVRRSHVPRTFSCVAVERRAQTGDRSRCRGGVVIEKSSGH